MNKLLEAGRPGDSNFHWTSCSTSYLALLTRRLFSNIGAWALYKEADIAKLSRLQATKNIIPANVHNS